SRPGRNSVARRDRGSLDHSSRRRLVLAIRPYFFRFPPERFRRRFKPFNGFLEDVEGGIPPIEFGKDHLRVGLFPIVAAEQDVISNFISNRLVHWASSVLPIKK